MSIKLIKKEAEKARCVFEKNSTYISSIFFGHFPTGACGNSSDLLGTWLEEKGIEGLEYVNGMYDGKSHGWLEFGEWIVDITSDQFEDGCDPVFISKDSSFHDSFEDQSRCHVSMHSSLTDSYNKFSQLMDEE